MKIIIQRVSHAKVTIDGKVTGEIREGFMVLVGVSGDDCLEDAEYLAEKCVNLRVFSDSEGKMNLALKNVNGSVLSISQFTLYADTRKGRRPSFVHAANPELGMNLYDYFNKCMRDAGIHVETGIFGAMMDVELVNSGPVTIIIDSAESGRPRRGADTIH